MRGGQRLPNGENTECQFTVRFGCNKIASTHWEATGSTGREIPVRTDSSVPVFSDVSLVFHTGKLQVHLDI